MELPEIDDFEALFLDDTPLIDVRAPVEFAEGAFPTAHSLPLMNDQERHEVGICYKEKGQEAAVELGNALVAGDLRARRIANWRTFAEQHPQGALYCFRGGMRSQISQRWLYEEAGILYPRIKGGYKALRQFLLQTLEDTSLKIKPLILGGRTGVGKTLLLQRISNSLDLERLAWHRGSAFGRHATPQPSQIDFENALAIALLQHLAAGNAPLLVEDESRNIGSRNIPDVLFDQLKQAPLILLEEPLEQRVEITLQEYVVEALAEYQSLHGLEEGFSVWASNLTDSLSRIKKRLGGARHADISTVMEAALAQHHRQGDISGHREWIAVLLHDYYDPMYDYQIVRHQDRVVFKGNRQAVLSYLESPDR